MQYHDMINGIREARQTMALADQQADDFARILEGRLRHVSPYTLANLKKELAEFNAHTKEWKS